MRGLQIGLAWSLEDRSNAHATANAQRGQTVARLLALKFVQQLDHQDGPTGPDRMAKGDRTARRIELLLRNLEFPSDRNCNSSECFVDLNFPRYNAAKAQERAIFKSILWALQRQLPVEREPDLLSHWEWLYARSLGCVGLLKQQINQALGLALAEKAKTVTVAHLRKTALHKEKAEVALEAILEGEKDFLETEDADRALLIKLGLRQTIPPENRADAIAPTLPAGSPPGMARRPGERAPGRDPVGTEQQAQEGERHEDQRVAG